jgi:hypothetical protein
MRTSLSRLRVDIADSLEDIRALFKTKTKITLIVRSPSLEDADVIISDDDFELAIQAVRQLQGKGKEK